MADQAVGDDFSEDMAIEVKPRTSRLSGKKLVLFILLPALLLIGGGAAAYFTGLLDPLLGRTGAAHEEANADAGPSVFYDMPELLVNLNSNGKKTNFLKIRVSFELPDAEAVKGVEAMMPRIIDSFQVYLRELRIEDLRGSAGLYRLREELLLRVNAAVKPVQVKDVLFKDMLVQ